MEKDREATEQRLIAAMGELIEEKGFEKVGVNAVAERAGVSKMLIYRYFNSLDGLIYAYIQKNDFWTNPPANYPPPPELKDYLKKMIRNQIRQLRKDIPLKRLRQWELSTHNPMVKELFEKREAGGMELVQFISGFSTVSKDNIAALATLINSSITYLILLEENFPVYNGIPIQTDEGWEKIAEGIDYIINLLY